jgi:hypothetical protein
VILRIEKRAVLMFRKLGTERKNDINHYQKEAFTIFYQKQFQIKIRVCLYIFKIIIEILNEMEACL